jgi:predicted GH43/DUF377 family glycosyl hydrolase
VKEKLSLVALWACLALLLLLMVGMTAVALEPQGIVTVCPPPGTGCDYTVIQEAIDNADPGDTVRVAQGVYTENLTVSKPLMLEGGYESIGWTRDVALYETVIDGSSGGTVRGDWDGGGVRYPAVIHDHDGGTYEMWFAGRDLEGLWRIGYATSPDGLNWTKHAANPVLDVGAEDEWDASGIVSPFVIKESPTSYKMWYSGGDESGTWRMGYATSSDGIHWAEHPSNPVLDLGDESWNNVRVLNPSVVYEGGLYKMWLHTAGDDGSGWLPYIAYAASTDGVVWAWDANNPLLSRDVAHDWESDWIWGPSVLHGGGGYQMWYSAWGSDEGSTGYATAPDETAWTKYGGGIAPVLAGTPGEWDEGYAYDPFVLYAGGTYTMYYDNDTSIGVATSSDGISWSKSVSNPALGPGAPGQWGQPGVQFVAGSDGSTLDGFTVRNGDAYSGGGVLVEGTEADIRNCAVLANSCGWGGGGIALYGARATIDASLVMSNAAGSGAGGGILATNSVFTLTNSLIVSNVGFDMAWDGDGICVRGDDSRARLINNTIVDNSAEGVQVFNAGSVLVRNNILYGNDGGIHNYEGEGTVSSDHNAFWDNGWDYAYVDPGTGDISADPAFRDAANDDYRLRIGSPCVDAGTPEGAPAADIEGAPRDAVPDIGAYEWTGFGIYLPLVTRNS